MEEPHVQASGGVADVPPTNESIAEKRGEFARLIGELLAWYWLRRRGKKQTGKEDNIPGEEARAERHRV